MMRKRREKFLLEMKSGVQVATVDELRANFDLEKILNYLENGKLEKFLRDRFYTDEADALKNFFAQDKNTQKKFVYFWASTMKNLQTRQKKFFGAENASNA